MRSLKPASCLLIIWSLATTALAQESPTGVLTQNEIVRLLEFKVPEEKIVEQIKSSGTVFVLGEKDIERLKKAGATDALIQAMGSPAALANSGISVSDSGMSEEITDLALVVDYSGSMMAKTKDGVTKVDAAKTAVESLVDKLPGDLNVAMVVYGTDKSRGCESIDVAQPLGPLDRDSLKKKARSYSARGMTPIADSLKKANDALAQAKGGRAVILVTDGAESCKGDPTAVARDMAQRHGTKFGLHVIGFDLKPEERKTLEGVASAGRGKYFNADNAAELAQAMQKVTETVAVAPKDRETTQYQAAGQAVRGGEWFNTAPEVKAGEYKGDLRMKETRYYRVPVKQGQELRAIGQFKKTPLPGDPKYNAAVAQDFLVTIYDEEMQPVTQAVVNVPESPTSPVTARATWTPDSDENAYVAVSASQNYVANHKGWVKLSEPEEKIAPSQYTLRIRTGGDEAGGGSAGIRAPRTIEAKAGSGFDSAGTIDGEGLVTGDIKFGENAFYAVPVKKGDLLEVIAAVQKPWQAVNHYYHPLKSTYKLTFYDDDQVEAASQTLDVKHNPSEAQQFQASWPATLDGKAYVVLSLADESRDKGSAEKAAGPGRYSLLVRKGGEGGESSADGISAETPTESGTAGAGETTRPAEAGASNQTPASDAKPKDPFSGVETR